MRKRRITPGQSAAEDEGGFLRAVGRGVVTGSLAHLFITPRGVEGPSGRVRFGDFEEGGDGAPGAGLVFEGGEAVGGGAPAAVRRIGGDEEEFSLIGRGAAQGEGLWMSGDEATGAVEDLAEVVCAPPDRIGHRAVFGRHGTITGPLSFGGAASAGRM